jgi:hypothetical protein
MSEDFKFDLAAKRTRLNDDDLMSALQQAAETFDTRYFTSTEYDGLPGKRPHSATIIDRFGSWKKALSLIGIAGGRERRYSPEQLVQNLEEAWKKLGYPPGKRQIATLCANISESPYKHHWGSLRAACESLAAFHNGKLSQEKLLAGDLLKPKRITIPLNIRWAVQKRDHNRCVLCGACPSNDHSVELEIDHIIPVAKGGGNEMENLQTLCWKCNQGKKDRTDTTIVAKKNR